MDQEKIVSAPAKLDKLSRLDVELERRLKTLQHLDKRVLKPPLPRRSLPAVPVRKQSAMRVLAGKLLRTIYPGWRAARARQQLADRLSKLEAKVRKLEKQVYRYSKLLDDRTSFQLDEAVRETLIDGYRFCARYGLSLGGAPTQPDYDGAIAELTATVPVATTINPQSPDVSIIIPVYGQLCATLNCLQSFLRLRTRYSIEVIIADDASPEDTGIASLQEIPWLRYLRRPENGGFIANCNAAAAAARGSYLVLLNNDTRVVPNWLDELIGSFAIFPKAGLVGSKLYNPDGSLQEAGSIVRAGAIPSNYGRNGDPNNPLYSFARLVDYCSGAAIAVPAGAWAELGGFDMDYSPAYWEDVDLAYRLRQHGYEVWFQPLARVIHYEGTSHGRDLTQGTKAYQVANAKRFLQRWDHVLKEQSSDVGRLEREANRFAKRRMLVVDAITPAPDQDAGSVITTKMIEAMQQLGWDIVFVAFNLSYVPKYTAELQRVGVECHYKPYLTSFEQVLDLYPDIEAVLGYRVGVLAPFYDELRERLPAARILFHDIDLHYLREEREAELLNNDKKRAGAASRREQELDLMAKVDCTLVPTEVEKRIIEQQLPVDNVLVLPYVVPVRRSDVPFEDRRDLMFLGGYRHPPNVDAVRFFISEVWPLLLDDLPPSARFMIVGANPPDQLTSLASDRVIVTGHVAELGPYFDQARVFVAPLRYGAGVKGKVIQSMAYGLPTVMSSIGAEGIMLTPGEEGFIADSPEAIRQAVLTLFRNRDLWLAMQAAGYAFVERNHSWERCLKGCEKAISIADQTWTARKSQH